MSVELPYPERLLWDGRTGVARYGGRQVRLWDAPGLSGEPVHTVDYIPCVGIAEVQPRPCDPRRAMTEAEIVAALLLLAALTEPE